MIVKAFLWELTVHLFLPIYFYTHTKPSLSNNFFVKEKRK